MYKKLGSVNQFTAFVALCLLLASSVPAQNYAAPSPSAQEITRKLTNT